MCGEWPLILLICIKDRSSSKVCPHTLKGEQLKIIGHRLEARAHFCRALFSPASQLEDLMMTRCGGSFSKAPNQGHIWAGKNFCLYATVEISLCPSCRRAALSAAGDGLQPIVVKKLTTHLHALAALGQAMMQGRVLSHAPSST